MDDITGNVTVEKRSSHMGKRVKVYSYICKVSALDFSVIPVKRVEGFKGFLTRMDKGAAIDDVLYGEKCYSHIVKDGFTGGKRIVHTWAKKRFFAYLPLVNSTSNIVIHYCSIHRHRDVDASTAAVQMNKRVHCMEVG
jgi:hypothetical protein